MATLARWLLLGLSGVVTISLMFLFAPTPGLQRHEAERAARAEVHAAAYFARLQAESDVPRPPARQTFSSAPPARLPAFDSSLAPFPSAWCDSCHTPTPEGGNPDESLMAVDLANPNAGASGAPDAAASPRTPVRTGQRWHVHPGQLIQDAIEQAQPGDTVLVEPGVYHEALVLDRSDLTVLGVKRGRTVPVLDGRGRLAHAVVGSGSDLEVGRFSVRNYTTSGITAHRSTGLALHHLTLSNTGQYGVYPAEVMDLRISHATIRGARIAGIYVSSAKDVHVRRSTMENNQTALILENTVDAHVSHNTLAYNAGGLVVTVRPGGASKVSRGTYVHSNRIYDNNRPHPRPVDHAADHQALERAVAGTGILVAAGDGVVVRNNTISNNSAAGIRVFGLHTLYGPDRSFKDVDPAPDDLRVNGNRLINNGLLPAHWTSPGEALSRTAATYPAGADASVLRGSDLEWDLSGTSNSWNQPRATSTPRLLPHDDWGFISYRANQRFWTFVSYLF